MWKVPFGVELNDAGESGEIMLVPSFFAMLDLQLLGRWRNSLQVARPVMICMFFKLCSDTRDVHIGFMDESPFFCAVVPSRRSSMHRSLCGSWAFVSSFLDASLPFFEAISARHQVEWLLFLGCFWHFLCP